MIDHLAAVEAHLTQLGYTVHLLEAVEEDEGVTPPVPYVVLSPGNSTGYAPDEMPACSTSAEVEFDLRVTAVGGDVTAPGKVLARVRGLVSPDYGPSVVPMTGRVVTLQYLRSEVAGAVDRDVTAANTNRHPGWAVDSYRLTSQPL